MNKEKGKYMLFAAVLVSGIVAAGFDYPVRQEALKGNANPAIVSPAERGKNPTSDDWVAIDTVINNDTVRVVLLNNSSLIKCSINRLHDTRENTEFYISPYSPPNIVRPILIPGVKKRQGVILNDSVLIISLCDFKGRSMIYLLNRTKKSLKFAAKDAHNPIGEDGYYMYVDLKNNTIITHGRQDKEDHDKNPDVSFDTSSDSPYWISRYTIQSKHFVRTDLDTSFFKEFLKLDLEKQEDNQTFYNIILQRENWKRDKYAPKVK